MDNILFLVQYNSMGSSSRGKMSGGVALRLEDLYDKELMNKLFRGHYMLMYAYPRCSYNNIVHMGKEEFKEIFSGNTDKIRHLIDEHKVFRKEVYEAYTSIKKVKPKLIRKLVPGHLYLGENGFKYLYLGNVEFNSYIDKKVRNNNKGNLFIELYKSADDINDELVKSTILRIVALRSRDDVNKLFLRGIKKIVEDLGDCNIDFEEIKQGSGKINKSVIYSYERTAEYTLTVVNE